MERFAPLTPRRHFDLTDLLSFTGMIVIGYVFLTCGPMFQESSAYFADWAI